ncbi:MAG TPA: urease accessory UreF family protein [Kiritimatiellia bacterium]|nr:urease accessory UreF family protein [Kiritimatiellia bacterium]
MDTALLHWLQTSDSAFPVGAFSHSMGLEGWIHEKLCPDEASLEAYLTHFHLPLLEQIDLPILRHAHDDAAREAWAGLEDLDCLAWACRGSHEARDASARIGRQRLRLLHELKPAPAIQWMHQSVQAGTLRGMLPVVSGIEAHAYALPLPSAQLAYGYQTLAAILAASTKLMRIGQRAVQSILLRLLQRLPETIQRSQTLSRDAIGGFFPSLDLAEARHETQWTRLFIS